MLRALLSSMDMDFLEFVDEASPLSTSQNRLTCCNSGSAVDGSSLPSRMKLTLPESSSFVLVVDPSKVHPRGDRTACGSPLLPLLSSNTQKASGTSLPISRPTSFSVTLGSSIPCEANRQVFFCRNAVAGDVQAVHSPRFRDFYSLCAVQ